MAHYRSPFYPSLQVFFEGGGVKFIGGTAEVADEDVEAFDEFLAGPHGREYGIVRDDGLIGKAQAGRDPADEMGPGYTPAEREAYRRARAQTAPPPPADQRTEGVQAAASIPVFPDGVDPRSAAPVDPAQAALDSADAAHALREEQALAAEREAASDHSAGQDLGTADTAGAPDVDAQSGETVDDDLEGKTGAELKDILKGMGQPTSGTNAEKIARIRGNG